MLGRLPKPLRSILEWMPVIVVLIIVASIWQCAARPDVVVKPTPTEKVFAPMRIVRLAILEKTIVRGQPAHLLNGLCNDSAEPVIAEVYLAAQRAVHDPVFGDTFVFVERPPGQGQGRGKAVPIDPGCIADDPIESDVPADWPPGRWRLFLEVVVRGPHGEIQTATAFSDYFDVE